MVLPTGQISFSQINSELGRCASAQFSINDSQGRLLASVGGTGQNTSSCGLAPLNNYRGHAWSSTSINSNTRNINIASAVSGNYSAGKSYVNVTVGSGVVVGASCTGSYAMVICGFTSGDAVGIVNNGYIVGAGGAGGCGQQTGCVTGHSGGNALYVNFPTTITNNGYIWGGGGGGGGGHNGGDGSPKSSPHSGGGGGGGAGCVAGGGGSSNSGEPLSPGSAGSLTAGGSGGIGGQAAGNGGAGGGPGTNGSAGDAGGGGSAGYYVVGSGNVTWALFGDRRGNVS